VVSCAPRLVIVPRRFSSAPAAASLVTWSVDDKGLGVVTLNNPGKRNPLSTPVLKELQRLLKEANESAAVRAVVVASTGPVFSSGHDVREFTAETSRDRQMSVLRLCSDVNFAFRTSPKPTIASVQGLASAAGCQLAASCDFVIASNQARFLTPGASHRRFCHTPGISVADRVSPRKAFEMLLLAEEQPAEEAQRFGLVNRVVADEQLAAETLRVGHKLCGFMAVNGWNIIKGKECFLQAQDVPGGNGAAALRKRYDVAEGFMLEMFLSKESQAETNDFLKKTSKPKAAATA